MFPAFNVKLLKNRLIKLNKRQQILFGTACCERMLKNYRAFKNDTGSGDISPLREALDFLWEMTSGLDVDINRAKLHISRCEFVAPNSEDFDSLFVTSAQDACFAICSMMDFLIENDVDNVVQVAIYATDSVDLYVQEIERMEPTSPNLESDILTHSLMQNELENQEMNLKEIEINRDISVSLLEEFKKRIINESDTMK